MNDAALVKLDTARAALAECKTAMESKQIADIAEAARVYLERTNASVETVNRATEVRILAERQMGAFLADMPKNTGCAGNPGGRGASVVQSEAAIAQRPRLKDMGITLDQSSRAQKLAAIPKPEFTERIAVAKASGGKLSTAKVLEPKAPQGLQRSAKVDTIYIPSNGLMYARIAIAQLEKIDKTDKEKAAAFELVRNYLNENGG